MNRLKSELSVVTGPEELLCRYRRRLGRELDVRCGEDVRGAAENSSWNGELLPVTEEWSWNMGHQHGH